MARFIFRRRPFTDEEEAVVGAVALLLNYIFTNATPQTSADFSGEYTIDDVAAFMAAVVAALQSNGKTENLTVVGHTPTRTIDATGAYTIAGLADVLATLAVDFVGGTPVEAYTVTGVDPLRTVDVAGAYTVDNLASILTTMIVDLIDAQAIGGTVL